MYIAIRQYQINSQRLKHELFNRRFAMFEAIGKFMASVTVGPPDEAARDKAMVEFLLGTSGVRFLFNKEKLDYCNQLRDEARRLQRLEGKLQEYAHKHGRAGTQPIKADSNDIDSEIPEIKRWFREQLGLLEDSFAEFLELWHCRQVSCRQVVKWARALVRRITDRRLFRRG
jgi:hypothetical protein